MTQDALVAIPTPPTRPAPRHRHQHPAEDLATRKHWRGIRATWCRGCKTPILTGLDSDECALQARVDATPLTAIGEALALLAGRQTFTLRRDLARSIVLLERRNADAIRRRPAEAPCRLDALAWDIHAEHRCTQATPAQLTTQPRLTNTQTTFDPTLQPPF